MNHARIGVYTLTGNLTEATQQVTDGLMPLFKSQPGFVDYSVVSAADGKIVSISTWESMDQANSGTEHAAKFVADKLASHVTLDTNYVGDVVVSSR